MTDSTRIVRLDSIADVRDGTHDTPAKLNSGVKLVTSRQLKGDEILATDYFISAADATKVNQRSKVDKWDILITMIGTVGDIHLVDEEPDYVIKNIGLIKPKDEYLAKYLFYFLKSGEGQAAIASKLSGTSQAFISLSSLRSLPIRIPERQSLEYIAKILWNYDELIKVNYKKNKNLRETRDLLLPHLMSGEIEPHL